MKMKTVIFVLLAVWRSEDSCAAFRTPVVLTLDWAMNWGEWGFREYCPEGTFAYAFQIKVEDPIDGDDTSMNGIELFCREPTGVSPRQDAGGFTITSTVQRWGDWKGKRECSNGYLTGLRMKSEESQGRGDDTAANDLDMQCDWSTETMNGGGNRWGRWSGWSRCPRGWAICGLQTRVEAHEPDLDDTALNNVRMFCCTVDGTK